MELEFLKKLGFIEEEKDINKLKISLGKVEFDDDDNKSKITTPDLRYYWDGESFGLHISDCAFLSSDWIEFLEQNNKLLEKISVLYFGRTQVDTISLLTYNFLSLESLYLSENSLLSYIGLKDLNKLVSFEASHCPNLLKVEFNGNFDSLEKIDLSNCSIDSLNWTNFPSKLYFLKLDKNKIGQLLIEEQNIKLKYLYISNNDVHDLQILGKVDFLIDVDLSNNRNFTKIPDSISQSKNSLQSLDLSNTAINLNNLKLFLDFEILESVFLFNTTIEREYPEEIKQGWSFVKLLLIEKAIPFLHQKVLLLGDPNVGKSNLLFWWKNGEHPVDLKDRDITHGANYTSIDKIIKTTNGEKITLHFWDFGGQDYFHATHQLFFSNGSLNLLLWAKENPQRQGRNDNNYAIDYWLRCIQQLSQKRDETQEVNGSVIDTILVQNKFDLLPGFRPQLLNQEIIAEAAYSKNLNLYFTNVLINPEGNGEQNPKYLNHLEELISEILSHKNFNRPESWVNAYESLVNIDSPVVNINSLSENLDDAKAIAQYFHDKGLLLYFQTCCENKIFTKPDVFLDFLYNKLFEKREDYKITYDIIDSKLNESKLRGLLSTEEVLAILKYFNLVFEIPDILDTYFIPQFLPEKNEWISFFEKHQFTQPTVIIKSDYYLMNQAMLVIFKIFGKFTKKGEGGSLLFWKDGIIIEIESKLVQIKLDRKSQSIEIYTGIDKVDNIIVELIVAIISNPINAISIFDNFNSKSKNEITKGEVIAGLLALSLILSKGNKEEEKEDEKLTSFWNFKDFNIFIRHLKEQYVSFSELRQGSARSIPYVNLYEKQEKENDSYDLIKKDEITSIYGFNQYLKESLKGARKKLMISYSKDDLKLVNEFTKHLEPLVRNGDLEKWWYCTDLEAGQVWEDKIEPKLKTYDIICFMISASFYNNEYIREKEIKIVMDRFKNDKKKPMIVPIILQPYHWVSDNSEYNLGKFTALPYTAKPVSSFGNRQEAWHIIGECLRVAIRNNDLPEDVDFWLKNQSKPKVVLPKDVKLFFEKIIYENTNGSNPPNSPTPPNEHPAGHHQTDGGEQ